MSEYRYKYQGELNDAGKLVCCLSGCEKEAHGGGCGFLCREHSSLLVPVSSEGTCHLRGSVTLKPEHPSTANASYTIAHGFYATGPKGGR